MTMPLSLLGRLPAVLAAALSVAAALAPATEARAQWNRSTCTAACWQQYSYDVDIRCRNLSGSNYYQCVNNQQQRARACVSNCPAN